MKTALVVAAGAAWLFLAAIVYQVFLAGVGVFGAASIAQHRDFGYLTPLLALILLIAVGVTRRGALVIPGLLLLVLTTVQTILPWFKLEAPLVAALHPVNALVVAFVGLVIARRATAAARAPEPQAVRAAPAEPAAEAV